MHEAFASLDAHGYRHIPVVEGPDLVGIVSLRDLVRVSKVQPVVHPGEIGEAPPGLEGVIVAETQVGDVRGLEGFYHYRQYSAVELADRRSLEDIWFLLFDGHLPTRGEPGLRRRGAALRPVPDAVRRLLPDIAAAGRPLMDQLRTAVSLLGHSQGFRAWLDVDAAELRAKRCRCAPRCPRFMGSTGWRRAATRSTPIPTWATARTTCGCSRASGPTPTRPGRSSSTRS